MAWPGWLAWIPGLDAGTDDQGEEKRQLFLGNGLAVALGQPMEDPKTHKSFTGKYLMTKGEAPRSRSASAHPELEPSVAWEGEVSAHAKVPAAGLILAPDLQNGYSTGFTIVADFMENSPSHRCGMIKVGDRITKVDGISIFGRTFADIAARLRGRERSTVVIEFVDHKTDQPYTVRLTRHMTANIHSKSLTEGRHQQALPPHRQTWTTHRGPESYHHSTPLTAQEMWKEANELEHRPIQIRSRILDPHSKPELSKFSDIKLPTTYRFL